MPRKIIFAEDEKGLRDVFQIYFQRGIENSEVDVVPSGEDLIEKVRSNNYDLIVSDYHMRGITGIEATSRIREFNTDVPIIILSGEASQIEKQALYAGANGCINKRDEPREIAHKIEEYLPKSVSA